MGTKNVRVTSESATGLNRRFYDPDTRQQMTRGQFATEIERGLHPDYDVMRRDGLRIPRSNPDRSSNNNLG